MINGRPYAVAFDLPDAPRGKATLRAALCGTKSAGNIGLPPGDGAISRHSIQGLWYERGLAFDAALLKQGPNTLTIPAGPINNGVIYDYLRLELDESATATP